MNQARDGGAVRQRVVALLPKRYTTPTTDYAAEKALKDVSSRLFFLLDRVGIHLAPKHFYTTVPDYAWLRANRAAWDAPSAMPGVHWDLDEQLSWVRATAEPYLHEVIGLDEFRAFERSGFGPGYGPIEAQFLHAFVRSQRPQTIIEVGSGVSTATMYHAAQRNEREGLGASRIVAIEPYPREALRSLAGVDIIDRLVQLVPLDTFEALGEGDLLFIDSSHAVKTGSDVVRLFLDVIPRLRPGVFVHIHDINFPYLYPRLTLIDYFGWQEAALLLALLINNPKLHVLASLSALHYERQTELKALFPDYIPQDNDAGLRTGDWLEKHIPDSFWMRTS